VLALCYGKYSKLFQINLRLKNKWKAFMLEVNYKKDGVVVLQIKKKQSISSSAFLRG
jgi:hypothetical protein